METKRIGNYDVLEKIGQGGMGAVYRARQRSMDRIVALKILPPELSADEVYVQRFIREARSAGRLHHPGLIQVYEVGKDDAIYFFSMEYVNGPNFRSWMEQGERLDEKTAVRWMRQLADALAEAHRQGIVHRDIKPSNILLSERGDPKIADLGLAKPLGAGHDVFFSSGSIGTPYYMAPEQVLGETLDGRADLYALGATFYHLLSGRPLFSGESYKEIMEKQARELPEPIRNLRPDLSPAFEKVLHTLLQKDPADRYARAEELVERLRELEQPAPPAASATSGRFPKVQRSAVAAMGVKLRRTRRQALRRPLPAASGKGWKWIGGALSLIFLLWVIYWIGTKGDAGAGHGTRETVTPGKR